MSGDSSDVDIDDQQPQQKNFSLTYAAAQASTTNRFFQDLPFSSSSIFPDMPNPSMVFGQNNLCLPNIADFLGQQISMGQAFGFHNAGLFAANGNGKYLNW
ncbi:hypothetical protein Ddc_12215 [Ditylenchus destructor]|nr:hypothetical protein Ddc_12215 [Ditylenchus destructor]